MGTKRGLWKSSSKKIVGEVERRDGQTLFGEIGFSEPIIFVEVYFAGCSSITTFITAIAIAKA